MKLTHLERMSLIDDFNILELRTNATEQEAKAAYRRLARRFHPDKNPGQDTTEHFQRIHDAYQNVLAAIRRSQDQSWKPYSFTEQAKAKDPFTEQSAASDAQQREYVKEQQRAYQEMKRENAEQERAREEALRTARSTLHQRRMNALYEEMRKAESSDSPHSTMDYDSNRFSDANPSGDAPNDAVYQRTSTHQEATPDPRTRASVKPFRLHAAKAAFIASTYLGTFAAGIYATNYWTDHFYTEPSSAKTPYISGLYPQYRRGVNHTLEDTRLFTEPSVGSTIKTTIADHQDVTVQRLDGDWLTLTYGQHSGWAKADHFAFGSNEHAQSTGCVGQPGLAPRHGATIGATVEGSSRLRIVNQLTSPSLLTFQSLDGQPPFSIYLQAQQPFAANFIPKGRYRLVLQSGSLYHHACQNFLFDRQQRVVMDSVNFASTEQSLTLRTLTTQ